MEPTQAGFSLSAELNRWQLNILSGSLTPDDASELTQHLTDEIAELKANGLSDQEAWMVARHRMGEPVEIDMEFSKVNPDYLANRNLLMMFWGASIFMLLQTLFFVLPGLLWFFSKLFNHGKPQRLLSIDQTQTISYIFSIAIVAFTIFNLIKPGKLLPRLNGLIIRQSGIVSTLLIIIGGFSATLTYKGISHTVADSFHKVDASLLSLDLLAFTFYGSLIFCTAWFTMRYRDQEFRSLRTFGTFINWAMSLALGIMLELVVCFSNIAYYKPVKYTLIITLFGWAGYVIGRSKTVKLNLLMLQMCAFYVCFYIGYYSAHHFFLEMASEYLATLAAIFVGGGISRKKFLDTQMA